MLFDTGAREQAWDKNLQLLLVLIIGFNVLPHITSIPVWTTAIAFLFLSWKALSLFRNVWRPPRPLLYVVASACSVGVFFEYQTIIGQEAASALLVILASAKLLETNRYRDAMFVIFTAFFLLMAHLLDSQSILTTVYMAVDVMLITALMFQLHKQERRRSARSFRPVMKLLLLAIPVWIFLFVMFPRFSAGLWGQQPQASQGGSFSDNLDPGSIESLTENDQPAFRVTFAGRRPKMSEMYWRGGILTESNGLAWNKSKEKMPTADIRVPLGKVVPETSYEVYLEPRFQQWIFALDFPDALVLKQSPMIRKRPGLIFENMRPGTAQVIYQGTSTLRSPAQRLLDDDRQKMLQLPSDLDPRIYALAKQFADEARTAGVNERFPTFEDRLAFVVDAWFDKEKFRYTKSPGSMKAHSGSGQLAEFLFEKKMGFCEHYAAAFATLMRAAGIPARVTVGFLGASKNSYSDYYLVRDLDAHAWTEVWHPDPDKKGVGRWMRVDPTATIVPLRLEMGGDFNLLDPATYSRNLTQAEADLALSVRNSQLYFKAAQAWDALQMKWLTFLNDYDFEFQKSFLETLGLKKVTRWILLGIVVLGVGMFALALSIYLRRRNHRYDPVLMAWREFCRKLDRVGFARESTEGPLDFTVRVAAAFPQERSILISLGETYASLRYGTTVEAAELRDFRREVRRLRLKAPA